MALFLVLLLPLTFLLLMTLYLPWAESGPGRQKGLGDFFWGLRALLPGLLIYLLLVSFLKLEYQKWPIFFYFLFRDYLFWLLPGLVCYALLYDNLDGDFQEKSAQFLGFALGFYLLSGVLELILSFTRLDSYVLFLLPLNRIAILLLVTLCFGFLGKTEGYKPLLLMPLLLLAAVPAGFFAMWYYTNHGLLAWLVGGGFFLLSAGAFVFMQLNSRPRRRYSLMGN